jgi:adenylate cyclase
VQGAVAGQAPAAGAAQAGSAPQPAAFAPAAPGAVPQWPQQPPAPAPPIEPAPQAPVPEPPAAPEPADALDILTRIPAEAMQRQKAEWLAASEGERREATVFYADVSGYTRMSGQMDHEDVTRIMEQVWDLFVDIAFTKYEGFFVKTAGDACLITFGAPLALEDAPERAIRAALEIQDRMAEFRPAGLESDDPPLKVRIGINTGEVMAGGIMADGTRRFDVMGTAVNIAQRLESAAPVGGILVSQEVRDRAGDSFEFESMGGLDLKNVAEPVQAYVVKGFRRREGRLDRAARYGLSRMVGRRTQQREIEQAWQRAQSGEGQILAITGEAGVGKSRLIHECAKRCGDEGARVVEGYCLSFGYNVPYLPIRDLIRSACGIADLESDVTQRNKLIAALRELDLADETRPAALGWVLGVSFPGADMDAMDAGELRATVKEAVVELLVALSQDRPTFVVIDDVQWLDSASEEILVELTERMVDSRMLVAYVHRLDYAPFWESAPSLTSIELSRLSPTESLELLSDRLEGRRLKQSVQDEIVERAAGNPFFLEEIVRNLITSGQLDGPSEEIDLSAVPATVYELLMARLDRLGHESPQWRGVLQLAAVVGPPLRLPVLAAVGEAGADPKEAVEALVRLRFLRKRSGQEEEYDFEHHLAQEVAYNSIPRRRRSQLHRRVAQAMEDLYADRLAHQAHVIGFHFERAGLSRMAIPYLGMAIEADLKLGLNRELHDRITHGLSLLEELASDPDYKAVTAAFYVERGSVRTRTGEASMAIEDCHRALELAMSASAPDVESQALHEMAYAHTMLGDYAKADRYFRLALKIQAVTAHRDRIHRTNLAAALVMHQYGDYPAALATYRQILEAERASANRSRPNVRTQVAVLINIGSCLQHLDQYDEALEYFREVEDMAADDEEGVSVDPIGLAYARANNALIHYYLGRCHQALEIAEDVLEVFRETDNRFMEGQLLKDIAWSRITLGQYDYALASAREAVVIAEETQSQDALFDALLAECTVLAQLGDAERAVELSQRALEAAKPLGNMDYMTRCHAGHALALAAAGRTDDALQHARIADEASRQATGKRVRAEAMVSLGEVLRLQGHPSEAALAFEEATHVADEIRSRQPLAMAKLGLGRVRAAQGDASGVDLLRAAAEHSEAIDYLEGAATAHLELARVLRARDDITASARRYLQAIEVLGRLSAGASVRTGPGSPSHRLLEVRAEATGALVEAQGAGVEEDASIVTMLRDGARPDELRAHDEALASLLDRLVREVGIEPAEYRRN